MRRTQFENEYFYHIYNRGIDQKTVFYDKFDYIRFVVNLNIFNNGTTKLERDFYRRKNVNQRPCSGYPEQGLGHRELRNDITKPSNQIKYADIVAYAILPNHFHLLLKQNIDSGISKFLHKLGLGYTNYYNKKNNHSGYVFQGKYKAIKIRTGDKLNQLSAYIHGNPEIHGIAKAENWIWSSYLDYLGKRTGTLPCKTEIMSEFNSVQEYGEYVKMVIGESRIIKEDIKSYLLEI
jgi:putative transposase